MRPLLVACLLLAGCGVPHFDFSFQGVAQECDLSVPVPHPIELDVLFVIDDSPAMQGQDTALVGRLGSALDQLDTMMEKYPSESFHIGVVSADPADGGVLRGGCGLGGDLHFIDWNAVSGINNLNPDQTVVSTFECLAAVGTQGSAAQTPLDAAYHALHDLIRDNREFRRRDAALAVVWIAASDYAEPQSLGVYLHDFTQAGDLLIDPYEVILESIAVPTTTLHTVVNTAHTHLELPFSPDDDTPIIQPWLPLPIEEYGGGCFTSPLADPAHPDCVVEDLTERPDGHADITEIPDCASTRYAPPCWELTTNPKCEPTFLPTDTSHQDPQQLSVTVDRPPEGAPPETTTRIACDCVAISANDVGSL